MRAEGLGVQVGLGKESKRGAPEWARCLNQKAMDLRVIYLPLSGGFTTFLSFVLKTLVIAKSVSAGGQWTTVYLLQRKFSKRSWMFSFWVWSSPISHLKQEYAQQHPLWITISARMLPRMESSPARKAACLCLGIGEVVIQNQVRLLWSSTWQFHIISCITTRASLFLFCDGVMLDDDPQVPACISPAPNRCFQVSETMD